MQVTIWSHFKNESWTGEIEHSSKSEIFRLFNVVDDEDALRLKSWNYNLPSLSMGDTVTVHGKTWLVAMGGWIELTDFENEILHAQAAGGEISVFDPALHRIRIVTASHTVVYEETNDNNDDGYADGAWVSWENKFSTVEKALKHAGRCRVGISGVIVTVVHDGEEVRA